MMKGFRILLLLSSALLAFSGPVWADMTWTEDTHSELLVNDKTVEKDVERVRIKLKTGGVRIEDIDEGTVRFCNFTNRFCVVHDQEARSFDVISNKEIIKAAVDENREHERSIRQGMSRSSEMPEDARSALQAEFDSLELRRRLWGQPISYQVTGERAELGGHPCRKYIGGGGDLFYIEVWIAENIKPEAAFLEYSRFLASLDPYNLRYYSRVPGFPIKIKLSYGPLIITTETRDFSEKRVPVSEFLLPEGTKESSAH
jgi:hypothetical protein